MDAADHQFAAHDLAEAFADHDAARLVQLSAPERAEQLRARLVLQSYLAAIWEAPKIRAAREGRDGGEAHPGHDPAFACVAGLLDLASELVSQAAQAQADAGDDTSQDPPAPRLGFDRFEAYPDDVR